MKHTYNFVNVTLSSQSYQDVEEEDGMTYARFGAAKDEQGNYSCAEASIKTADFDLQEAKDAYERWKASADTSKLNYAKRQKVQEIERYDTSDKVNGFRLNGTVFWLDKATRVGLMNSTEITKAAGQETTDLWMGDVKLTIPCDTVIKLLSAIEMYALECFNTTARHKAEVAELKTVEEVEKYDIKEGYPKQLEINLQR